jgi:hypothetical protein
MNLGHVLRCVSKISTEYLSYDVLTTSEHSYFMAFPDLGRLWETDLKLRVRCVLRHSRASLSPKILREHACRPKTLEIRNVLTKNPYKTLTEPSNGAKSVEEKSQKFIAATVHTQCWRPNISKKISTGLTTTKQVWLFHNQIWPDHARLRTVRVTDILCTGVIMVIVKAEKKGATIRSLFLWNTINVLERSRAQLWRQICNMRSNHASGHAYMFSHVCF